MVCIRVNGVAHEWRSPPAARLIDALREDLGLKGTRLGCGENACGACHVLMDGRSVPACDTPLWAAAGRDITTVEGLTSKLQAQLRQAFVAEQAAQCGFCSSGMLMGAAALLLRNAKPSDAEVRRALHTALAQIVADALALPFEQVHMLPVDTDGSPDEGVTSGSLSMQDAGAALRLACSQLRAPGASLNVGQSLPRRGLAQRLAGQLSFIHDLAPSGLCHCSVLHPPQIHARLLECDEAAGARWQDLPPAGEEAADLHALPAPTRIVAEYGQEDSARLTLKAVYSKPWIAHASIGLSCALAHWDERGSLHVWSHGQGIFNLRRDLALAFGVDTKQVRVTHAEGAGCYGHNGAAVANALFDALGVRVRDLPLTPQRIVAAMDNESKLTDFTP